MNFGIEDETLEFKKTTGELNEAMNSISAMLNKHGKGTIYFGILPNGNVCGQMVNDSTLRDVSRKIFECIEPRISPKIEKKIIDDKTIIELTFSGTNKPYSSKGIYYIRTADEDRVISTSELRQLFEYNKNNSWDKEITSYTIDDINNPSFERFFKKATSCGRLNETEYNVEAILSRLNLMRNGYLTNAAYYLFSNKEPVTLKMAIFATDAKLTFIDINRIKGNIFDLIDIAYNYIKEHINWKAEIAGVSRVETPEIPLKAIREIVCNSFAHARYNEVTEHEIDIHPSKVVIYNPGEFPIGYKPEDFVRENLSSIMRNPIILDTLYLSDDVETYSSGFRKVYTECNKAHVEVSYQIDKLGFSFIFKRKNIDNFEKPSLTIIQKAIIDIIKKQPNVTLATMSEMLGKSARTIQREVNVLKEKGFIERIGKTKGYWNVLK